MSARAHGAEARALAVGALCLLAPLAVGGAPAWSQATLSLLAAAAALQLSAAARSRGGARLASPGAMWLAGPLLSLAGALLSLAPLRWLRPHLSVEGAAALDALTDPLDAAALGAPLWGGATLTPVETLSWAALQATFCLTAYLAYHLHPHRLRALQALALAGPALTLYGLTHEALDLRALYGAYASADRAALTGFVTPIINHNSAASLMLLSGLVALGLSATRRPAWALCAALSALGVWRCEARAAVGVGVAALGALACLHPPAPLRALGARGARAAALLAAAAALALTAWWARASHLAIEATASWSTPSPYPRLQVWRDALSLAQERWALGVGRGAFGEAFTRHQRFSHRQWISHVESHPLEQLLEGGALGLLGGALLPAVAWLAWRARARGEAHAAATALWLGLGAVGAHQCFDFGLNQAGLALPVAVGWGALWSYIAPAPPPHKRPRRPPRALTAAALLSALTAALALAASPHQLRPTLRALAALPDPDERAARAARALGHHPTSAHITQRAALGHAAALGL
ncbi:MAG: hypothetical protein FJ138_14330, partial [Deltaproteobacteria bacterium]|nr:hypothetical protein [Deltaproteobacteria bacterium]